MIYTPDKVNLHTHSFYCRHGKGNARNRHELGIEIDLDSVGGKDFGGHAGEDVALDAAVVADCHGRRGARRKKICCQTLGGPADHIFVHAVGAGSQNTSETRSTELEIAIESIFDCLLVHCLKLRPEFGSFLKPAFILFPVVHETSERVTKNPS